MAPSQKNTFGFTTEILHHDRFKFSNDGAVHAPTTNSVLFSYEQVEDLCDIFQGKKNGHSYARQSTPSTACLESLIATTEDSPRALCFSTGMAAISGIFLSLLKSGDHLIASRYLFGNTHSLLGTLENLGIQVSLVDSTSIQSITAAYQANTKMVFVESLANPGTQIPDFQGIDAFCKAHNLVFVVDNTLTTGFLCKPKALGAHLVVLSLTKSFSGHGHVLGGAVVDTGLYDWSNYPNIFANYRKGDPTTWGLVQIKKKSLRDMGGTLSAESASRISIGLETLALRLHRACLNASTLAKMLEKHPLIQTVYHPSLKSHPQHERAQHCFKDFGFLLSLDLIEGYSPIDFLNAADLVIKATHLGDNRTLALPVAQTIFFEMGSENRKAQGIADGMIRCSIGIEDTEDLLWTFENALAQLK